MRAPDQGSLDGANSSGSNCRSCKHTSHTWASDTSEPCSSHPITTPASRQAGPRCFQPPNSPKPHRTMDKRNSAGLSSRREQRSASVRHRQDPQLCTR